MADRIDIPLKDQEKLKTIATALNAIPTVQTQIAGKIASTMVTANEVLSKTVTGAAELNRMAMLVDKAGGTLTTFGFHISNALVGPYAKATKWFEKTNKDLDQRYKEYDQSLNDLAMKEQGFRKLSAKEAEFVKETATLNKNRSQVIDEGEYGMYIKDIIQSPKVGGKPVKKASVTSRAKDDKIVIEADIEIKQANDAALEKWERENEAYRKKRAEEEKTAAYDQIANEQMLSDAAQGTGSTDQPPLESKKKSETMWDGYKEGLADVLKDTKTTFQQGQALAATTSQAMSQSFETFFFDAFEGRLKSFNDYFQGFAKSIEQSLMKILADQMAAGIMGGIGSLFSGSGQPTGADAGQYGPKKHSGGLIMHSGGYVPRFHVGGLAADERPAILQTGEYVVSRRGVAALDKINQGAVGGGVNVAINVENQTGQPVTAQQTGARFDGEQYIVGVVLKNIGNYGPLHHAIAGVR